MTAGTDTNADGQAGTSQVPAKHVLILGATGSIGRQTLSLIAHAAGSFAVVAVRRRTSASLRSAICADVS